MKKRLLPIVLLAITVAALLGSFVLISDQQIEFPTATNDPVPDDDLDDKTAPMPVVRVTPVTKLDSFLALLDKYDIEVRDPVSLREFEEELANTGSLEQAEYEYEEYWKDFVDSLELSPAENGQVRDVLVQSAAHNDELMRLFSANEISQSQMQEAWVSEGDVADALSNFLSPDQVQGYLNTYFSRVEAFAEDMLAWQSQEFSNGETGILHASGRRDLAQVRSYIDAGADLNMLPLDGSETPLLNAVIQENVEMARLLLANGADPNLATTDEFVVTPLGTAASRGDVEMIRLLVDVGAYLEQPSNGGQPLAVAAYRGRTDAVAELLILGAIATGETGSEALSWAIQYDDTAMEQMLIDAGAQETRMTEHAKLMQAARRKNGI